MNANKTKTMIVEKTPEKQCEVNVKGQRLTQVKQYKYLGTTVENTGQCKTEVANRINLVNQETVREISSFFGIAESTLHGIIKEVSQTIRPSIIVICDSS